MKKTNRKKWLTYAAVLMFAAVFLTAGHLFARPDNPAVSSDLFRAAVVSVDDIQFEYVRYSSQTVVNETVTFTARVRSGAFRGETVTATQYVDHLYPNAPGAVTAGQSVILHRTSIDDSGELQFLYSQNDRTGTLTALTAVFLILIVFLARQSALPIILSLVITCLAVFLVYLPAILGGANIYAVTVAVTGFIIITSLLLIGGAGRKTLAAILGNTGGVLLAGLLALLFNRLLGITGMLDEDYFYLVFLLEDRQLDLSGVVFSGIVIGALGAVMDVAMAISSAMNELAEHMRDNSFSKLLRSGMNIGRDAIGTMTNTLILAYIGSSLATVLLLLAYNRNPLYLFNLETIAVSIMQALVGSIGILAAVPATALISAFLFQKRRSLSSPEDSGEDFSEENA